MKKLLYKRVHPRESKIVGTLKTKAKEFGYRGGFKDVEITIYDTIQDTFQNNDCVGYTQLCRLLGENGWFSKYVMTKRGKMEQRLVNEKDL